MSQQNSQPVSHSQDNAPADHQTEKASSTHVHSEACGTHCHSHGRIMMKDLPRAAAKIGRNDPCPCGSQKKYKKCCLL